MTKPKKHVSVNERGRRIGESHPNAELTDHEVDLIRELHEGEKDANGDVVPGTGLSYRQIADKFDTHYTNVAKIVKCRRRAQVATKVKRLSTPARKKNTVILDDSDC